MCLRSQPENVFVQSNLDSDGSARERHKGSLSSEIRRTPGVIIVGAIRRETNGVSRGRIVSYEIERQSPFAKSGTKGSRKENMSNAGRFTHLR
jgi:hypothetical protein